MKITHTKQVDRCDGECEVYARVVGFYRPVKQFNNGKKAEFNDRKLFEVKNGFEKLHEMRKTKE